MKKTRFTFLVLTFFQTFIFAQGKVEKSLLTQFKIAFSSVCKSMNEYLFTEIPLPGGAGIPLVVLVLVTGAIFFTLYLKFINVRAFLHSIEIIKGKYDDPDDEGDVSHFQALAAALSATVGLGNIAGVAIAVSIGGPGAVFWMIIAAFFGMSSKFVECTLSLKYRTFHKDGTTAGGPMYYLERGFNDINPRLRLVGKILGMMFAFFLIFGSWGGGNMFQANQSYGAVASVLPFISRPVYGIIMVILVGIVIIGGIKRIASVTEKIAPFMCGLYLASGFFILLYNFTNIPSGLYQIVYSAFNNDSVAGGVIGVLVIGFQRAAFSNEAGIGTAPIIHSAAKTEYAPREGFVAAIGPFVDTILVCTMTGLVITVSGVWKYQTSGPVKLNINDFNAKFVLVLKSKEEPVSQYLSNKFSKELQASIKNYTKGEKLKVFKQKLADELNQIMKTSVYKYESLKKVALSINTAAQKKNLDVKNLKGRDLIRLNRLILEDAYPNTIKKITLFRINDFEKPFINKLKDNEDIVSQYLNKNFSKDLQIILKNYKTSDPVTPSLRKKMTAELNTLLQQTSFHRANCFSKVTFHLKKELTKSTNLKQSDVIFLNRSLLEISYPYEIKKSGKVTKIKGIELTSKAFSGVISIFPYLLGISALLFAFSTMVSYSYYGEICWGYLFGEKTTFVYKIFFLIFTFIGSIASLDAIVDFADVMIFSLVFINITGCIILSPKVKEELNSYWKKYKAGSFKTFK